MKIASCVLALLACGGSRAPAPTEPAPGSETVATPVDASVASEPPVDRCEAWIAHEVGELTWYIGQSGVLDHVDLAQVPVVIRRACAGFSDEEIACVSQPGDMDRLHCIDAEKQQLLRAGMESLLELPPALRSAAKAAKRCEYQRAMDAMAACPAVPERHRKRLQRAWSSTANVQTLPFWCHVGVEVMKQRLAALGC